MGIRDVDLIDADIHRRLIRKHPASSQSRCHPRSSTPRADYIQQNCRMCRRPGASCSLSFFLVEPEDN